MQFRTLTLCLLAFAIPLAAQTEPAHDSAPSIPAENAPNFANDPEVPIPHDAGFGPLDTAPPAKPVAEILQQLAAKESEFEAALASYTYRRSVKIQTLKLNKVDGEYQQVDDVTVDASGKHVEHTVFAPASTLERIQLTPDDFNDIREGFAYVFTTQRIGLYDAAYVGQQKVDELNCYVFDLAPKKMEKGKRYLKARIWVDEREMQIVVLAGKNIPDNLKSGHENISPPFVTYRAQIDGHYWFPVYTHCDVVLHTPGGRGYMADDVHVRQIIKYTDYKRFHTGVRLLDGEVVDEEKKPPK